MFFLDSIWPTKSRAKSWGKESKEKYRVVPAPWLVPDDEEEEVFEVLIDKIPSPSGFEKKYGFKWSAVVDAYKSGSFGLVMWDDGSTEVNSQEEYVDNKIVDAAQVIAENTI